MLAPHPADTVPHAPRADPVAVWDRRKSARSSRLPLPQATAHYLGRNYKSTEAQPLRLIGQLN